MSKRLPIVGNDWDPGNVFMAMKRLTLWLSISLTLAACSGSDSATTTPGSTTVPVAAATSTSTPTATTSTTQPAPPDQSLIAAGQDGINLLVDGTLVQLEGDGDHRVISAFDDLSGGLVYQYQVTPGPYPRSSILRIPSGASTPEVVISADVDQTIRLVDVESVDGRANVLYLTGTTGSEPDSLLMADLSGGAPLKVASVDTTAASNSGVAPSAILGGALSDRGVAVVWWYGDIEADCSYIELIDFSGTLIQGPIPEVCGEQDWEFVALSSDGSRMAYGADGAVEAIDTDTGDILGRWPIDRVRGVDFDGSTVFVLEVNRFSVLSLQGNETTTHSLPSRVSTVTTAREPVGISEGTFLGGIPALPVTCSASGMAQIPQPQGGLPEPVAELRESIVKAATACDIESLVTLTTRGDLFTYSFGSDEHPGRFWRLGEQLGGGPLARMVDVLDLPFLVEDGDDGRIYIWPSAFQENPTEDDWEALSAVYNEEDVDLFKEFGSYIGMRVGITEDGSWLFAVEGD